MASGNGLLQDPDVFAHIAIGKWILAHHMVPKQDVFSSSMPGLPWVAHEWLPEIAMALVYQVAGWIGLVVATSACFALAIAILMWALLRNLAPLYGAVAIAIAIAMCFPHLLARPHVAAYPILVVWISVLAAARERKRTPSLWWAVLIVLWANMHASFLLGLVFTAFFAAEAAFEADDWTAARRSALAWLPFCLLCLLLSLVTPFGIDSWLHPIRLMHANFVMSWVNEWQSPNMQRLQPVEVWLFFVLLGSLFLGLRLPIPRIAMVLVLLYMALRNQRNAELLGLIVPLLVSGSLALQLQVPKSQSRLVALALTAITAAFATVASARSLPRIHLATDYAPIAALRVAKASGLERLPVFNDYGLGGYLMFVGMAPFIDGRSDMYPDAFVKRFADTAGLPILLDQYGIEWTLLRPTNPHVVLLDHLPGWRRLYADDVAVIHVRTRP